MSLKGNIRRQKYLSFVFYLVTFLSFVGCSSAVHKEGYLETTVTEILNNPWKYHGKVVRVSGTFNECKSFSCRMCPGKTYKKSFDEDLRDACMGVSFESRALEKYSRYATATIEADYDASCAAVPKPGEKDIIIFCTDRASQMMNTRVIKIITRRAASQGHISMYGLDPLLVPHKATVDILKSTFIKQAATSVDIKLEDIEFVYTMDISKFSEISEYKAIEAEGGICLCEEGLGKCDKIWPTLEGHVWGLPADNPYTCWHAQKINGEWHYPLPQ